MQKAIIIYNEGAGFGSNSQDELKEFLQKEGYEIQSCSLKEEDLDQVFQEKFSLAVVAGGDGTVKAVASHLCGKDVPIFIWPQGTSNNIANTFGLEKRSLSMGDKQLRRLNMGHFRDGKKEMLFLESAGVGLISHMMEEMIRKVAYKNKQEKIGKSLEVLQKVLEEQKESDIQLYLDGDLYHDKYLGVEIMNTRYTGPRLMIAPDADPGDGFFDVALISKKQAGELEEYLKDRFKGKERPLQLPVYRAREVKIVGKNLHLHVDDEILFSEEQKEFQFSLSEEGVFVLANGKEE